MFINKKIYELYLNNPTYSDMLRKIPSSPKKLYAIGNIGLLKEKSISIVGSRNSSEYGRKITKSITKDLVEDNIVNFFNLVFVILCFFNSHSNGK